MSVVCLSRARFHFHFLHESAGVAEFARPENGRPKKKKRLKKAGLENVGQIEVLENEAPGK